MDVLHTAIWVSDLETELDFYADVFGFERTREFVGDDGVENVFIAGDSDTEIQFKRTDEPVDPNPKEMDHIAIAVDDIDAVFDAATDEWGCSVRGGIRAMDDDLRIAFIEDPEGYGLELIEGV